MLCPTWMSSDSVGVQSGDPHHMAQIVNHNPTTVHPPAGGYSMGVELGQRCRLLFISGQVPETSDGAVPEGFEAQCEQAWRNVIEVPAAADLRVEHLVKGYDIPDRQEAGRAQPHHSPHRARRTPARADDHDRRNARQQMVAGDRGDCCGMNSALAPATGQSRQVSHG